MSNFTESKNEGVRKIGQHQNDPFYRYEMPCLVCKPMGKGNGTYTVLPNIGKIGRALQTPADVLLKYMSAELGTKSTQDKTTKEWRLNGTHTAETLQRLLDTFIEDFLICPECKLPEIRFSVGKSVKIICEACHYRGKIQTSHKVVEYLIRQAEKQKTKK